MNPNYTEFKFPQIKPHPWNKVFRPRTSSEAINLASRLLEYTPSKRLHPLDACAHNYFDELRAPDARLPSGRPLPELFNFTERELSIMPSLNNILQPAYLRAGANSHSQDRKKSPSRPDDGCVIIDESLIRSSRKWVIQWHTVKASVCWPTDRAQFYNSTFVLLTSLFCIVPCYDLILEWLLYKWSTTLIG